MKYRFEHVDREWKVTNEPDLLADIAAGEVVLIVCRGQGWEDPLAAYMADAGLVPERPPEGAVGGSLAHVYVVGIEFAASTIASLLRSRDHASAT